MSLEQQLVLHKRLALAGLGAVLTLIAFFAWKSEHDGKLQALTDAKTRQEQVVTLQAQLADLQKQQASFEQRVKQIQDQNERDKAALRLTIEKLKTPEQHAAWDQQQLEQLIAGIKIAVNPQTGEAVATIPKGELPQVTQAIEQCKECKLDLSVANAKLDLAHEQRENLNTQLTLKDQMLLQKDKQINDYRTAANGGTFWRRFKHDILIVAVSGGAGYVAGRKF